MATQARDAGSPPLQGLRVLELGGEIAAAYCTKLLTDLGTATIKVEPPTGDPLRTYGPVPKHDSARGSGLFQYLNAGKRSVALALGEPSEHASRARLKSLIAAADVVVESLGTGVLERSLDANSAAGDARVLVRVSPFGQTGPYRERPSTSLVVQAAGGWVARIGTPQGPPYYVGGRMEEYVAGAYAAAAALTALRHNAGTHEHTTVDVSIFECMVGTVPYPMLQKITFDRLGFPIPQRYQPIPGILACRDGFVGISALTGQHWADVCAILELPELAEKMREVALRGAEWHAFLAKAEPWLSARTAGEIVELFQAVRVPAVPIGDGRNLVTLEPFVARSFFIKQPGADFARPDAPFRLSASPALPPRPAPRLGAHDEDTFAYRSGNGDADGTTPERAHRHTHGASHAIGRSGSTWGGGRLGLPFTGLKVLDLTSFWAGPYLTMYLASFGADVVKIESPRRPDGFRFVAAFPQLGDAWWEQSPVYHATNLGKRDVAIDLDDSEGRALVERLITEADVVAENFSPRVLEHFGLGYEQVRRLNPRAIMLRMPGFGLEGPCRDWVGWALTFEQMAGCANLTGEAEGRMFAPGGFADPVVGMHAAVALQAALAHREATGQGQLIEVSQIEVVAAVAAEPMIRYQLSGEVMARTGNRSASLAPQGVYPSAGNDEWIAISCRNVGDWNALCRVIGDEGLVEVRDLAQPQGRMRAHDEIDRQIAAWTATLSAADAARILESAHVPAARLLRTEDMYGEVQLEARHYFQELEHPVCGRLRYPGWPMRTSFGPTEVYGGPAPTLGQHGEQLLSDVLGVDSDEIARLRSTRVIGDKLY